MEKEKRMLGEYEIIHSISISEYEIVVGESKTVPKDERYMCAYIENTGIFEIGKDCLVGESYPDLMTVFGERIAEKAEEAQKQLEKELELIGNGEPLTLADCAPVSKDTPLEGKIVVINPEVLRHEYQLPSHQLHICTGGFGAHPNARGRTVFCTSLLDGSKTDWWRNDIIGIMPEDKLPEWAKAGLGRYIKELGAKRSERSER